MSRSPNFRIEHALPWSAVLDPKDSRTTGTVLYRDNQPIGFFFAEDMAVALHRRLKSETGTYRLEFRVPWQRIFDPNDRSRRVAALVFQRLSAALFTDAAFANRALVLLGQAPGVAALTPKSG